MKNNVKKCRLKKDKVEHALFYHFSNDGNRTQIMSPEERTYSLGCAKRE